jgi:hypothetical protein
MKAYESTIKQSFEVMEISPHIVDRMSAKTQNRIDKFLFLVNLKNKTKLKFNKAHTNCSQWIL